MRSTSTACRGSASSDVPPRTASSALMPSALPRSLTRLTNGAGNVFSRPTSNPMIFLPAISLPLRCLREVPAHHVRPVGPIVRPAGPDFEIHVHALVLEQPRHLHGVADVRVLLPGDDHLWVLRGQRREVLLVREPGREHEQAPAGVAEVEQLHVPAEARAVLLHVVALHLSRVARGGARDREPSHDPAPAPPPSSSASRRRPCGGTATRAPPPAPAPRGRGRWCSSRTARSGTP